MDTTASAVKRILVVDDVPTITRILEQALSSAGYKVAIAATAGEGITLFRQFRPDLVILDIALPDISGLQLCRQFKNTPDHPDIPVIIITAHTDDTVIDRAFAAGADEFVTKPINTHLLEKRVHTLIARNSALHDSERKYKNLVETINDWIWEVDADGVYTYASPKVREILGYLPEEVIGKTPFDLMPEKEAETIRQQFIEIVAECRPFNHLVNTNIHKDGTLVCLETSGTPIFDKNGNFCGYRGVDRDISARIQAENALRTRDAALFAAKSGIIITTLEGTIEYVNPALLQLWGYSEQKELTANHHTVLWHKPDEALAAEAQLLAASNWAGELLARRKDSSNFIAQISSSIVRNAQGAPIRVMATVDDITDRKREEEKRLAHELRQRDMLVRETHHRIKNNLQGVSGLLRQYAAKIPEMRDVINHAVKQVESVAVVHGLQGLREGEGINLSEMVHAISLSHNIKVLPACNCSIKMCTSPKKFCHRIRNEEAVPLALIINELLTNALKHGDSGAVATDISIEIFAADSQITLAIANPVSSYPPQPKNLPDSIDGLGLNLIKYLIPANGCKLEQRYSDEAFHSKLTLEPPIVVFNRA